MNIIFGREQAQQIGEKYVVLELDTFQFGEGGPTETAFCIVDNVPFAEISEIDELKSNHSSMIEKYKNRDWADTIQLVNSLYGKWNGELDSYYDEMSRRLDKISESEPSSDWSYIIIKNPS